MSREPSDGIPVAAEALRALVRALTGCAGVREAQAALLADLMGGNDLRGFGHASRQVATYSRDRATAGSTPAPRCARSASRRPPCCSTATPGWATSRPGRRRTALVRCSGAVTHVLRGAALAGRGPQG